ncbi:MAG TPA: beta-propeller fold lactonase family protein [Kofleriaceae bacterium]|nr:beta-propeller fold lactonase family protein [Kofleriaceae bacterium]
MTNILPLLLCAIATLSLAGSCGKHAASRTPQRIYVSNEADGTVSVIDAAAQRVTATIQVGKRPRGLRVSHDGHRLYVALSGSPRGGPGVDESKLPPADRSADGIGIVDLDKLELVKTIASGQDPESFDLVGDHQLVVSNEETAEASIVDLDKGAVTARVPVGREPEGVTTAPDGLVYVTSETDSRVSIIDPKRAQVVANVDTGLRPRGVLFSKDGARAFVSDEGDATITVIDTQKKAAVDRITLPTAGAAMPPRPMGLALSPNGHSLYVTTGRAGSVAVLDAGSHALVRMINGVGARPWGIAVGANGTLYTANGPSNDVSIIDPATGHVLARLRVGNLPWGVAIDRR